MKNWKVGSVLSLVALAILSSAASANVGNVSGKELEFKQGNHVLTPKNPRINVSRILYAPSQADDAAYRAAIGGAAGAVVDYFDASSATPDAALLETYDCVYTWTDYGYDDAVLFGDRLADFVDGGGHVVLGVFTADYNQNHMEGRIMTAAYSPVVSTTGAAIYDPSAYVGDGTSCIHTGVISYSAAFHDVLALQGSGIADGHYADGQIAHAYRPDHRVIYSSGAGDFVNAGSGANGDWPTLIANTCACADVVPVQPSSWSLIKNLHQ